MKHDIQILVYGDRSKAVCSCKSIDSPERFGKNRVANSKLDILSHLEKIAAEMEYQIGPKDPLECPLCDADLDFKRKDARLLKDNEPMIIECFNGHDWDTYLSKGTLFLFPMDLANGPFSTT